MILLFLACAPSAVEETASETAPAPAPTVRVWDAPPAEEVFVPEGFDPAEGGTADIPVDLAGVHALPGGHRLVVWRVWAAASDADIWLDWTAADGTRVLYGEGSGYAIDAARGRFAWQGEGATRIVDVVAGTDVAVPEGRCTAPGALRFTDDGLLVAAAPILDTHDSAICVFRADGARVGAVLGRLDWGSGAVPYLESELSVHGDELRIADCRRPELLCGISRISLANGLARRVDVPPPAVAARVEIAGERYRVVPAVGEPSDWIAL